MPRPRPFWLMAFMAAALLTGCLPARIAPETPELTPDVLPDATAYPTSPAGPLPELAISDVVVKAGENDGDWLVLGMATNDSSSALEAVRLRVELVDAAGTATAEDGVGPEGPPTTA